jgi:hypothetical protein
MLLFGYATLFVVAFPLAPAVVAIAVALNLYLDRNLILFVAARPTPDGAASIGAWLPVFEAISLLCAVSNLGVVVFSNPSAPVFGFSLTFAQRLVFFVAAEHLVIAIKIGIARFFADITPHTALQMQRQAYLVDKHINGVKDVVVQRRGMYTLVGARTSMRAATLVDGGVGVGVAHSYAELEAASAILGSPAPRANAPPPGVAEGASTAADYKARSQV